MLHTYEKIIIRINMARLGTKKHVLDYDISEYYKVSIKGIGSTHKLVPLGEHQRNITNESIQTYKNHPVGLMSGLHESFPKHLWCQLLPQAEIKLNLQRQSSITPKISAYANFHGPHNFMHNPLAPLGCPLFEHKNPDKRIIWSDHAVDAWNFAHIWNAIRHSTCTENTQELREFSTRYFSSTGISPPQL